MTNFSRRDFLGIATAGVAALAVVPSSLYAEVVEGTARRKLSLLLAGLPAAVQAQPPYGRPLGDPFDAATERRLRERLMQLNRNIATRGLHEFSGSKEKLAKDI